MRSVTSQNGQETKKQRYSPLSVANKDPGFEYGFRRKKDIEDGGGVDMLGYEPVNHSNYNGEAWDGPKSLQSKSKGAKQITYLDTILCKRPLETSKFFKTQEDEKYNSQVMLVKTAARRTREKLRQLDAGAVVVDESKNLDRAFRQRKGPTEE